LRAKRQPSLDLLSVDSSSVAQAKVRRLAASRGVELTFELAELETWPAPENRFKVTAAIFIHFARPDLRTRLFEVVKRASKPGRLLL